MIIWGDSMKNLINFNFGFNIDNIRLVNNNYYFLYSNIQYVFYCVDINKYDLNGVFKFSILLHNYNSLFHEIIPNKDNQITTMVGSEHYVLLKVNVNKNKCIELHDVVDCMMSVKIDNRFFNRNNQFDWVSLWQSKMDYFEYYINNVDGNNPYLNELINYYIGLGENAISYVIDTLDGFSGAFDNFVVSHRRIDPDYTIFDLYNPLNVIVDHMTRDIAEYFKGLFIKNKYNLRDIEKKMSLIHFNELEYRLFFGRLLFPSFFFDNYELYVNGKIKEKTLLSIVNRIGEYEVFLKKIHVFISSRVHIPEINWLKKVDV